MNTANKILGKGCPFCGEELQHIKHDNKQWCSGCGAAFNKVELEEMRK